MVIAVQFSFCSCSGVRQLPKKKIKTERKTLTKRRTELVSSFFFCATCPFLKLDFALFNLAKHSAPKVTTLLSDRFPSFPFSFPKPSPFLTRSRLPVLERVKLTYLSFCRLFVSLGDVCFVFSCVPLVPLILFSRGRKSTQSPFVKSLNFAY